MKNGIFVADEPELSLHLRWQTKFIKQLHEINPNIQLIFATHSPELVGPFRNKIIKIQKYYRKIQQDISFNDNSIIDSPMELDDLDELFR